jgi:inorganic triphosphatase YgiF
LRLLPDWDGSSGSQVPVQARAFSKGNRNQAVRQSQLKRRWKKIRKRGRLLAKLDPRSRHKLRIDAKKLRYATEFIFMHEKLTAGMAKASISRPAKRPCSVYAAGLLTGHEEARFEPLLTASEAAFRKFEKSTPSWT